MIVKIKQNVWQQSFTKVPLLKLKRLKELSPAYEHLTIWAMKNTIVVPFYTLGSINDKSW